MLPDRGCNLITVPYINVVATGQNIDRMRIAAGFSVKDMQAVFGFATPQAIYKWIHGTSLPTIDNLVILAAILGVTMDDIAEFSAHFRRVPKANREECLQRALNLVPDENIMLLAGILMDKSQDKEIVELVFNDVLNRGEEVKQPILRQIFKDKTQGMTP